MAYLQKSLAKIQVSTYSDLEYILGYTPSLSDPIKTELSKAIAPISITVSSTGSVSQTLNPDQFYNFTGALTDLTIAFGTAVTGKTNEYKGQFLSGATAPTVTFPNGISWVGGSFPTIEANKTYQFSVLNNIGVIVGV